MIMHDVLATLMILWLILSGLSCRFEANSGNFNVVQYGAKGDGKTENSKAFVDAWKTMCSAQLDTANLIIPRNKKFLLDHADFSGPCKSASVHVSISGNLVALEKSLWTSNKDRWILFSNVNGLIVDGGGQIDGQGHTWWINDGIQENSCNRPVMLAFHACNGLQLSQVQLVNSPSIHISINFIEDATISKLLINTTEDSPNTDGINVFRVTRIQIKDSYICGSDDCIAINSGSAFINITNVACGPGHGISVGSLGRNGAYDTVEEVNVTSCNFTGTMYGARIKTWQGGSGYARKIKFENIQLQAVNNPILIDQYYCNGCKDCPIKKENVKVSDITYIGVQGTSNTVEAITLNCSQTVPCTKIYLEQVHITSHTPGKHTTANCINAYGKSKATPTVPLKSIT